MIKGFSKLTKEAKIEWLIANCFGGNEQARDTIATYWHSDTKLQKLHDEFIENTITNFYLPMGIAPNFLINGKEYTVPMVTEESSVVAAAAKSAGFWADKGGFKAKVKSTTKIGHVHFLWKGEDKRELAEFIDRVNDKFYKETDTITANMRKRGGGVLGVKLVDKTKDIPLGDSSYGSQSLWSLRET